MFIKLILFLATWIILSFAEQSPNHDVQPTKQAFMRFQEIQEEKDPLSLEYNGFSKRAQMSFQDMIKKKDYLTYDSEDFYLPNDYKKRTLMGFQGMRGKKAMSEDEHYKRAPMGFQGMRGKKFMKESSRGKKSYFFEYPQSYEKRLLAMGFQGMRGKKAEFPTEWEKRALMGFQGMRGKKTLLDNIDELEKRALAHFQGTKDKKDALEDYVDYYMNVMDFDKRVPMGFQGMRGKKNSDKRVIMDFQDMRNKRNKEPRFGIGTVFKTRSLGGYQGIGDRRNGLTLCQVEKQLPFRYFEIRGKKNPQWGSRGKFVGVRGKKWATAPYEDSSSFMSVFDNIERIGMDADSSAILDLQ